MNARLYKKLRSRFFWYKEAGHDYWFYYDNRANRTFYAYRMGLSVNDALMYELMKVMHIETSFVGLRNRLEMKRIFREQRKLQEKFAVHFNQPKPKFQLQSIINSFF